MIDTAGDSVTRQCVCRCETCGCVPARGYVPICIRVIFGLSLSLDTCVHVYTCQKEEEAAGEAQREYIALEKSVISSPLSEL